MAHDGTRPDASATGSGGIGESLHLVERWEEDEGTRVGPGTVLKRHKALLALARRLGARSLAEATVGDVEGWLATVAPRTKETYATAVRSFYRWAVAEQLVSAAEDPSRGGPPPGGGAVRAERRADHGVAGEHEAPWAGAVHDREAGL